MKKNYLLLTFVLAAFQGFSQNTDIDLTAVDPSYTVVVDNELSIDVSSASSTIAAPAVSFNNPFYGESLTEAEIRFDLKNYYGSDSLRVLGSLVSMFDANLGRMYFSNGGYLGVNLNGDWMDANMNNFGLDQDFFQNDEWKTVKLRFDANGFAVYVNDTLAYDNNSTNVMINGSGTLTGNSILTFLSSATTLAIGTGSWWSDNSSGSGFFWDQQYSYLKNITLSTEFTTSTENQLIVDENDKLLNVEYYNMNGQKVGNTIEDLRGMPKTIYVKRESYKSGKMKSVQIFNLQ
jgi:hypothetical protein